MCVFTGNHVFHGFSWKSVVKMLSKMNDVMAREHWLASGG
nr:MAG TPA: hypothetical protein [Caudoviricetes sp.]